MNADEEKAMWQRQYAIECFIPMGDRDYLCARSCYRLGLTEHFLWNSLQALEKYLKAILLLNGRSSRGLGHNVERALRRVLSIDDVAFQIPADVLTFVEYLNSHAPNRYLERPYYTRGRELLQLDKAVWYVRRYCQYIRSGPKAANKSEAEWIAMYLAGIHRPVSEQTPHRFHLFTGFLEDVLKGRHGDQLRSALVWNNFFFGRRSKKRVRISLRSQSAIPPHFRHPGVFAYLSEVVDFPADIRRALKGT